MTRTALSELVAADLQERPTLRFLTCGSVDDGKSTLIGRLLYEQNHVFDDQLAALQRDSAKHGTTGDEIDFALLVDGLEAERQQGITIDVAYRYFRTPRRSFIVADTPGHEQYTRNMATGASNADLAILLVDARKGLLTQTCRHATIVSLLGIRNVVLAVNKIDLVGFDEQVFTTIVDDFHRFAARLDVRTVTAIPLSARHGDNLSTTSPRMPWFKGPALIPYLEEVEVHDGRAARPFRMPVQWINRPDLDFRGIAGTIAGGRIAAGDAILVAGSGRASKIARIVTADGDMPVAEAGDAVTLTLTDEIDVTRGDILAEPGACPTVATVFGATLVWMGNEPLRLGHSYFLKLASRTVPATVSELTFRLDVSTFAQDPAATLQLNEIGRVTITLNAPIALDPYADDRTTGAFILIDRATNQTVAAGTVIEAQRPLEAQTYEHKVVTRTDRAQLKGQRAGVIWFTGRSASDAASVADAVERHLFRAGVHTAGISDHALRLGLNRDLGTTVDDRTEAVRRVAEMARLLTDAGLVVLCCVTAPLRAERAIVRELLPSDEFAEVYVDDANGDQADGDHVSPTEAESADVFEAPLSPAAVVSLKTATADQAADAVVEALRGFGALAGPADLSDWSI